MTAFTGIGGVALSRKRLTRFPSSPFIIRVPFFLLFGLNKRTLKQKGQKGTTQELVAVKPIKLETGIRPNSAGIPYTLLLRIEAIGFPTFGLLL